MTSLSITTGHKTLRGFYFRQNPMVRCFRHHRGPKEFDTMYRALFTFLAKLKIGQYFYVKNLCKKNPDNHYIMLLMLDIYYNMDFFVNIRYEPDTDKLTILAPLHNMKPPYTPRDMYTEIIKDPKRWGVEPSHILTESEISERTAPNPDPFP